MKKIILFALTIIFLLPACEDVLDREPLDIISSGVVWDDPNLVEAYIANLYLNPKGLRVRKTTSNFDNNWGYGLYDNLTDQCGHTQSNRPMARWKRGDLSSSNSNLMQWWGYGLIRKMNEFYAEMENTIMPDEDKNELTGIVKWLEAFSYWEMGKRYGGIPIITKAQSADDPYEELYPPRNKEAEVFDYAIAKLDEILDQNLLSETARRPGLPSRGAALALKSRIAVYAASIARWGTVDLDGVVGIDPSKEQAYWQQAYDAADELIKSGVYSLYPIDAANPSESFQASSVDETNPGWILAVEYDGETRAHNLSRWSLCQGFDISTAYLNAPYLDFVESFQLKDGSSGRIPDELFEADVLVDIDELFGNYDPRLDGSVLRQNSVFLGKKLDFYSGLRIEDGTILSNKTSSYNGVSHVGNAISSVNRFTTLLTGFAVSKRMNNKELVNGTDYTDFCILRLTEVILNRAEAAFYLNKPDQALADVNLVREHVGMPAYTEITDEEQIRYERNVEFFFEEIHYFDLKRWRKSVDAITKDFSGLQYIKDYETGKFLLKRIKYTGGSTPFQSRFLDKHYYLPITPGRIANNPQLVENPGYAQ